MGEVFIQDGDRTESRRRWADMIRGCRELVWNVDRGAWEPERPPSGSCVICHQLGELARAATDRLAKEGVWVVIVSQSNYEPSSLTPNVYRRGAGVERPTDEAFSWLFARFYNDLHQRKKPAWRLLEPDSRAVPEHVLA